MGLTVLIKALGYVEKRLLGHFYGAGNDLDVFFMALKIALFGYFLIRGILRPVLVPLLCAARDESRERARSFGVWLAGGLAIVLALATLGGVVFADEVVGLAAPGFDEAKRESCAFLLRLLLPAAALLTLGHLLVISLQVQKRFAAAALSESIQRVVFLSALVLMVAPLGFLWIGGAYWVGVGAMVAILLGFHRRHFRGNLEAFPRERFADLLWLGWPLVLGGAVSYLGRLVQAGLTSTLDAGSVSALTFAQTAVDLPLVLIPLSLSIVLFPYFSDFANREEARRSRRYLAGASQFLFALFLPLSICLFLFRDEAVWLLFRGGRFSEESSRLTALSLAGMAPGLPFFALEMVWVVFFFANRRILTAVVCGLLATGGGLFFLPWLRDEWGLIGVSAYLPLAKALKVGLLLAALPLIGVTIPWRKGLWALGRIAVAAAGAVLIWLMSEDFIAGLGRGIPFVPLMLGSMAGLGT